MVVWQGLGILAPLILIFITMILSNTVDLFLHTSNYADSHRWIYSIGALIGSAIVWYVGIKINRKPGRILTDEKTGERIKLVENHSCFYIPFEYWAYAGIIASVLALIPH